MDNVKSKKRITYEERVLIEDMLNQQQSFYAIAQKLERSVSTISRKIRNRRVFYRSNGNDCLIKKTVTPEKCVEATPAQKLVKPACIAKSIARIILKWNVIT